VIPRVFSGVFSDYNALQKQQGFDLSTYAGETCTAYTYRVTNYEGSTDTVLAQLFVYRNRVIGGDILVVRRAPAAVAAPDDGQRQQHGQTDERIHGEAAPASARYLSRRIMRAPPLRPLDVL